MNKKYPQKYERNYPLLNYLNKVGKTQTWLAELLGLTRPSVLWKIKGCTQFHADEIQKIKDALKLTPQQVCDLFLSLKPLV